MKIANKLVITLALISKMMIPGKVTSAKIIYPPININVSPPLTPFNMSNRLKLTKP